MPESLVLSKRTSWSHGGVRGKSLVAQLRCPNVREWVQMCPRPPAFSLSLSFSPFRSPAHLAAKPNTLDEAEGFADKVGLSSRRELCEVDGSAIASSLNTPYRRRWCSSSFFFLAHGTQLGY